jgi:hypothetical protein
VEKTNDVASPLQRVKKVKVRGRGRKKKEEALIFIEFIQITSFFLHPLGNG